MTEAPLPNDMAADNPQILLLGVGCTLYTDEGFGVRVIEKINKWYDFPANVTAVDGGVLGVNLLGVISQADHLIVVDAIRNNGRPGDLYRIDHDQIPSRIRAKNSLHQVDFLEALTLCQAIDQVPQTVIVGIEPADMETLRIGLSEIAEARVDDVIEMVLRELDRLNASYCKRDCPHVSCDTFQNYQD
jgi:hydrogenase maturation protease